MAAMVLCCTSHISKKLNAVNAVYKKILWLFDHAKQKSCGIDDNRADNGNLLPSPLCHQIAARIKCEALNSIGCSPFHRASCHQVAR